MDIGVLTKNYKQVLDEFISKTIQIKSLNICHNTVKKSQWNGKNKSAIFFSHFSVFILIFVLDNLAQLNTLIQTNYKKMLNKSHCI